MELPPDIGGNRRYGTGGIDQKEFACLAKCFASPYQLRISAESSRFTAAGINAPAGDAASRISAGWWNPEALTGSGFTFIRAPERCSFPPEVNIGSRPIEVRLGRDEVELRFAITRPSCSK